MRILGIDPGTGTVGFGVVDTTNKPNQYKLVDAGVIKTPPRQALELRLKSIYDDLMEVIEATKPDEAAVEELFFAQNVTTALPVAHARGVILLAIMHSGLEPHGYTPLQIKQSLTGYGRAEKAQVQEMVRMMCNLKKRPSPDDAADALAAAITHAGCLS